MGEISTFQGHFCSLCGEPITDRPPVTFATCCQVPASSRYDLTRAAELLPAPRPDGPDGLWRYRAVLPLPDGGTCLTLGEGGTPLLPTCRLRRELGIDLRVKDESGNPTGSFKDRGLVVALSLAVTHGAPSVILPTAGNAGGSAAAYGALAGLPVSVHAPETTPREILTEIRLRGARLTLHPGSIFDAGHAAAAEAKQIGAHSVATFKEPGRVEGKKTMGYEIFEQLGRVPDVIVYPCGGGTGIVGMAQAFDEMEGLGWIGAERPRFYAVQSEGCAPIVRAFEAGAETAAEWHDPTTFASGLRVPVAFADRLILSALRRTNGGALAVSERETAEAGLRLARSEGLLASPEGAAALAGIERLQASGEIRPDETVVLFQTGSALKYLEAWEQAWPEAAS